MPCKLCGKETSNEYCHECYWRAKWPEHILNSPELEKRRKRSHKLKITELDRDKPEAVFQSVNRDDRIKGHTYTTTLTSCTCQDYAIGHGARPCKHILRLAEELGLFENEHFALNESDYTLKGSENS
ncbi:MAG: SWIM zinc finger family protein [Synergistaceae bacterium]|nr:SWIM zinc finger family protein [Synergistaceae bacterium]